jgi:hypothetical protein
MTGWPDAPVIYEIDTWPWLSRLRRRSGADLTLADVPGAVWDEVVTPGIDAVWLMGVWERSPAGLAIARTDPALQQSFGAALADLVPADIIGSPYCVRRYAVEGRLGGAEGLAAARTELARRGARLVLDYVPNHVALDNPAVARHPEWFVTGTAQDRAADPGAWFDAGGWALAHGRDPYFPPWPDVVQVNAFHPQARQATVDALAAVAAQCDGIRCDMAMLLTNDVFAKTWGSHTGPGPTEEFWPFVIERLHHAHPEVVLVAEAYWDMEWTLQQQGFDFCYDKRLYDRLGSGDAGAVRQHLEAGLDYQRRLIRFIENHDEPRAAATFDASRHRVAAAAIATLPGATLWHDGQFEGRRVHPSVFLARQADEPIDEDLRRFYRQLLAAVAGGVRQGDWRLLECRGWADNPSHRDMLAWAWYGDLPQHAVVVNLAGHRSQCRVPLPWPALGGRRWRLADLLGGQTFDRDGDELVDPGLFVDLPPGGAHLLAVAPA